MALSTERSQKTGRRASRAPGRAGAERVVEVACALSLALMLACSGGDPETSSPPPAAPSAVTRPSEEVRAKDPAAAAVAEPGAVSDPRAEPDDRIGEILDLDPGTGADLDELIRIAAEASDARVREAAVVSLGDSDDPRALDALVAASEDPDPNVVLAALDQLRWSDDRLAQDAILRLVDSPNPEIAAAAREGLGE